MNYFCYTFTCLPLKPTTEILIALLVDLNFESFVENENGLEAYIREEYESEERVKQLFENIHGELTYERREIVEQNWNATWESDYAPVIVEDKCIIRAPFHKSSGNYQLDVIINPEMSFGTGHHETTWLMTKSLFQLDLEGKSVLDMGCGTGVLAIAACKLDAEHVLDIDIEYRACKSSLENATLNNVQFDVQKGDSGLIGSRSFDLILANINKNVLLEDMKSYSRALNDKGILLMSGFFKSDVPDLIHAAELEDLVHTELNSKNDWAILRFTKKIIS